MCKQSRNAKTVVDLLAYVSGELAQHYSKGVQFNMGQIHQHS